LTPETLSAKARAGHPKENSKTKCALDYKTVRIFAYSGTREQSNKPCEARTLRPRRTLTPPFADLFTDFEEKKTDCFAV